VAREVLGIEGFLVSRGDAAVGRARGDDGAAAHLTATAFEQDRSRDAALQLGGFRVVRFTWRQIADDRRRVVEVVRGLL
jgi:hypothetical protein